MDMYIYIYYFCYHHKLISLNAIFFYINYANTDSIVEEENTFTYTFTFTFFWLNAIK